MEMNLNNIKFETSYGVSSQLPPTADVEIAFAGRSNVGKSSLINKLFNRKNLARVSSVPGKTVTINFFDCDGVKIVDLPGYGYAKRWAELMEYYFQSGRNIKLVFQLVDMRHTPSEQDFEMMRFMRHNNIAFAVVMTKSDKLNKTEYAKRIKDIKTELEEFGDIKTIPFSATKGTGTQEIISEMMKVL